jgi:c-di-GMP-binding flagellar brake protein YcgR
VLTHTLDLSAGGMLLAPCGRILDTGAEHRFQLMLAPGASAVHGRLEILRVDGTGAAGTFFTDIDPADRWRLVRFAIDIQRAQRFRHPVLDDEGLESIDWE